MHVTQRIASARAGLIVCAVLAVVLRWPAYGMPLDRDASVYTVIGRGLGSGELPYRDVFDHKQPLIYPVYGMIDAVGVSPRLVSAVVSLLAAVLVYAIVRRPLAPLLVVVLGASRFVHGFDLNTEHLLLVTGTLPIVVALLRPRWALLAGLLFAFALMSKAVAVLLAPALLIAIPRRLWWQLALGTVIPLALLGLIYLAASSFDDLWHWNVTYNREYASVVSLGDRFSRLKDQWPNVLLAAAAAVAAVVLLRDERNRLHWTLAAWLAGAVLGALAGGYAYAHYFVPVIVPAAALIALAPRPLIFVLALAVVPFALEDVRNLVGGPDRLAQRTYGANAALWKTTEPVGKLIHDAAGPYDRMYVAESEAGFYAQAHVKPASRVLYDSILALEPERAPHLCETRPRFLVLPHGVLPAYAQCLSDYTPMPGVPAPVVVLER